VTPIGIYIHIPFCERKCSYCNFNTTDFNEAISNPYVEAVQLEIAYWGRHQSKLDMTLNTESVDPVEADSIFVGGGTPSMLAPSQLGEIIRSCRDAFDIVQDAEITIEINPSSCLDSKPEGWLEAGINRASVGVQSFLDRDLAPLGRTHSPDDARTTMRKLRRSGFDNLSLDLIAGLPEQSVGDWEFNLREALALEPEHLSLYLLEVKEGTILSSQINRGQRPAPDDDAAAEMYTMICERTLEAGYEHYEISNFAIDRRGRGSTQDACAPRGGREKGEAHSTSPYRSRHNMKYWTGVPFVGIGCGAHSYDGSARWSNIKKTESYIGSVTGSGQAIAERRELSDSDRAAEALFMGLRLIEGVDLDQFRAAYGLDVAAVYKGDLARLEEDGLIELEGSCLRLTASGLLMSNEVFQVFV
jgi:oxygen-independent coproporphyrinogen-3 oxidase